MERLKSQHDELERNKNEYRERRTSIDNILQEIQIAEMNDSFDVASDAEPELDANPESNSNSNLAEQNDQHHNTEENENGVTQSHEDNSDMDLCTQSDDEDNTNINNSNQNGNSNGKKKAAEKPIQRRK